MINGIIQPDQLHFPETNDQREKLASNFRSMCYSLPSVTFRFLVILFIETKKTSPAIDYVQTNHNCIHQNYPNKYAHKLFCSNTNNIYGIYYHAVYR